MFQSVALRLLDKRLMIRTVTENIHGEILALFTHFLELIQHNIIALLMIQMTHGCNIKLIGINVKINRLIALFKNFVRINQIRNGRHFCIF